MHKTGALRCTVTEGQESGWYDCSCTTSAACLAVVQFLLMLVPALTALATDRASSMRTPMRGAGIPTCLAGVKMVGTGHMDRQLLDIIQREHARATSPDIYGWPSHEL